MKILSLDTHHPLQTFVCITKSLVQRQKASTTSHFYKQFDPFCMNKSLVERQKASTTSCSYTVRSFYMTKSLVERQKAVMVLYSYILLPLNCRNDHFSTGSMGFKFLFKKKMLYRVTVWFLR